MKIEIPFEIGDKVWFIHPKTMKATQSVLKELKVEIEPNNDYETNANPTKPVSITKTKYHLDMPTPKNEDKFYVWNIFKTKEELIKSL